MRVLYEKGSTITVADLVGDGVDARAIGIFAKLLSTERAAEFNEDLLRNPHDSYGHLRGALDRLIDAEYIDITPDTPTKKAFVVIRSQEGRAKELAVTKRR